ncbi:Hypothetical protein FKW44_015039 [Caligus rogercresseyi]|uniref:Uncharacterized protein n=1 Tax=Caligus rogercresseyi TaxID=217165 RepID=A0A7T8H0F1_CALRO|nr:Hypothetical protein FKW44_015039 [Caligus rogercresseyi]
MSESSTVKVKMRSARRDQCANEINFSKTRRARATRYHEVLKFPSRTVSTIIKEARRFQQISAQAQKRPEKGPQALGCPQEVRRKLRIAPGGML